MRIRSRAESSSIPTIVIPRTVILAHIALCTVQSERRCFVMGVLRRVGSCARTRTASRTILFLHMHRKPVGARIMYVV